MRLLSSVIPKTCEIVLHGDTHDGDIGCHHKGVDELLKWILDAPNRFFVHMGDAVSAILSDDKRYNGSVEKAVPLQEVDNVIRQYRPASARCLGWLEGNHEYVLARFGSLGSLITRSLKIPGVFGGYLCKLQLRDRKAGQIAKLFLWHGPRNSRMQSHAKDYTQRIANKKARLRMLMEEKASDCIVMAMGHTHQLLIVEPAPKLILSDDGSKIKQSYLTPGKGSDAYIEPDRRWYVNTGSYQRTQLTGSDSYAEIAGYDPIELGHAVLTIEDGQIVGVRKVIA